MKVNTRIAFVVISIAAVAGSAGCGAARDSSIAPGISPGQSLERGCMEFVDGIHTILGELPNNPAADVDLATVVWGQISAGEGSGDIVVFSDDTSWVVAATRHRQGCVPAPFS